MRQHHNTILLVIIHYHADDGSMPEEAETETLNSRAEGRCRQKETEYIGKLVAQALALPPSPLFHCEPVFLFCDLLNRECLSDWRFGSTGGES